MRKIAAITVTTILIGAFVVANPSLAEARFGDGAITDTVVEINAVQSTQFSMQFSAQRRTPRTPRRATPPRATGNPVTTIKSTYRDPSSRGSLLNCSFC